MATSSEYREAKNKYVNLKNDAQAVLDNLTNCQSFLSVCSGKLTKGIASDGESLDNNKVQDMDGNVQDMKSKLNVIIPALTAKINELESKAQAAAARERSEAEAEEERQRKQQEAANSSSRNN